MGEKLLPCPFCGGEAKVVTEFNRIHSRTEYRVRCKAINCTLRPKTEFHEIKDEAIRHWNTRKQMQDVPDTNVGNNGWIPVSERLPEDNRPVLCWVKSTTIAIGETYIIGSCDSKCWFLQTYEVGHHNFPLKDYEVLAWQPLPQPFEGE